MSYGSRRARTGMLVCGLMAAMAGGCQYLSPHVTDKVTMEIGLRDTHVVARKWNGASFIINAEVTLGDKESATFDRADYWLTIGDERVASGSMTTKVSLVPGEPVIIGLPIEVNYFRLVEIANKHKELITPAGEISCKIVGVAYARSNHSAMTLVSENKNFESNITVPLSKETWLGPQN